MALLSAKDTLAIPSSGMAGGSAASAIGVRPRPSDSLRLDHRAASAIGLSNRPSSAVNLTTSLRPPNRAGSASGAALPTRRAATPRAESPVPSRNESSLKVPGSVGNRTPSASMVSGGSIQPSSRSTRASRIGDQGQDAAASMVSMHASQAASERQIETRSGRGDASSEMGEISMEKPAAGLQADEMSSGSATVRSDTSVTDDDIFAPIDERVQTIDFSKILTQSIQVTKNEQKKKTNVLESLRKGVKNFFHEDRVGEVTDEQGNVELPMDPCVQAREDHDSGLVPSQRLFRLARHEQLQLQDRNLQHKKRSKYPHVTGGESVDDYEFAWLVKQKSQSVAQSVADDWRSRGGRSGIFADHTDGKAVRGDGNIDSGDNEKDGAEKTTGNTYRSKVGSNTVDFNHRIDQFIRPIKQESHENRSEGQRESEQEKARKAQLFSLCGLVGPPTVDALSPEEQEARDRFRKELRPDAVDGSEERFPCECCELKDIVSTDAAFNRAGKYYDLLFAHRKNDSFTVRFDMVHCLPRFLLHYKFHKRLYDCLDSSERRDLVKAATDITLSYNLGHCSLQIPHGKYRTNAYPAFFAYIIVPDHARYLEIFEVSNPPVKQGERQKKNSCVVPNWPDKSYVTEFWTYSKESAKPSDRDPRLAPNLYEKNVLRKLQLVQMPELLVTRRNPPSELASARRKPPRQQQQGDFDLFEDFVLIPHHEQPMLGFGSVRHPKHAATESRSPEPDIDFLHGLLRAMNAYVRRHVNTRQRRLDGREDLSCTVNLSLHHSYAFKGHQRVYGFVGFPPASTYWAALVDEQRRNAALAETAVTREDIRLIRAAQANSESNSAGMDGDGYGDGTVTETSADRTEVEGGTIEEALQEKLQSCLIL